MAKPRRTSKKYAKNDENGKQEPRGVDDDCRCKEMSKKTPRELLKVAIGDLSFWKKKK
ncbi:MAG: hypothetical protein M0Z60_06360 [Nitrospiraceae bacterium]|nr:hypothetical protein [Nitrospiraceae bacterium]